jgi:vancomycin resistance protein YoaR
MKKILFFIFAFVLIFSIFISINDSRYKEKIYPNVIIDGIDYSGMNKEDISRYFSDKNKKIENLKITLNYKNIDVATYSADLIKLHYDGSTMAEHAYLIGRSSDWKLRYWQKLKSFLSLGTFQFDSKINFSEQTLREYIDYIDEKYSFPAENALFKFENNKVTAFKFEKYGNQVLAKETLDTISSKVRMFNDKADSNIIVEIVNKEIKPAITMAQSNDFGIVEKVGTGKSDYTGSILGRVHNVILATNKFNGILIPKGDIFSFNKTIGDISASTGYEQAYIIKNGRTVLGDGGGVCQVSTTLFRAALNTGLPIIERWAHAYRVHYYENDAKPGFDSTVFNPSNDLKFKNNLDSAILIQTEIDQENNLLTYTFYGKKDSRKIEVSDAVVWDVMPPPDAKYEDDPTLPRGTTKQVDWAAPGTKARFHYKVTNNGSIIDEKDFYSIFKPWAAVYMVGTRD